MTPIPECFLIDYAGLLCCASRKNLSLAIGHIDLPAHIRIVQNRPND
jgi:hypothetical protein